MRRAPVLAFALTLSLGGACLGARQGSVSGDVADSATPADTIAPPDTAAGGDDTAPADAEPVDTATPLDAHDGDTGAEVDTGPTVLETGCCRVSGTLDGGHAKLMDAAACADACGEVVASAVCADPPVCCYVPERQNGTYVMPTSECADLGEVVEDGECPVYEHEVCCRWTGLSVAVELEESLCAATGGKEVLGDYCWDRPALGTQCCLMPDGERRVTSDYQCVPEGGQTTSLTSCWKPPTTGTCCAFTCAGARYFADPDQCAAEGGDRVDIGACAPPGAILP
ncbi:MAG: hypothetical protein EP329_21545 [Deltaproteobacteria bacterium]|nr:MAG: hypothetical protein EP329_21545 [Deltaproteobacteria bacterium]